MLLREPLELLGVPTCLPLQGRKYGVKIPMMHTKGKFKVLETESYIAVALPLDPTYIKVRFYPIFTTYNRFHAFRMEISLLSYPSKTNLC